MRVGLTIPEDVAFAQLRLERKGNGVAFDWSPIERVCAASGFDVDLLKTTHEDNVADLMGRWYAWHLLQGGERDVVADEIWAEALSELN